MVWFRFEFAELVIGCCGFCDWQVFKHYFEELEEESLRDNFVVVVRRFLCCFVLVGFDLGVLWFDVFLCVVCCSMSCWMK